MKASNRIGRYNDPEHTGDIHVHIGVLVSGKQRRTDRMIDGERKKTSDQAIPVNHNY